MRILKQLLLILLFLGIASATPPDFTPIWPITAITVFIFLALVNMLGSAISSPQLSAWVKTEYRELIAGIILCVIIYSFITAATGKIGVAGALTGSGNYIDGSTKIIENIMTNTSSGYDRAMHDIIRAGTRLRAAATYSPYMSVPMAYVSITYSTSPLSGVGILFSALAGATQGLANNIFLYEGILLLIKFSATAIPAVLLPISLSLRMIPFTRKIGNTLIAICIAALVFLPFSIYMVAEMHKAIIYPKAFLTSSALNSLDPDSAAMTISEPFCKLVPVRFILGLGDVLFPMLVCSIFAPWPLIYAPCLPLVHTYYHIFMLVLKVAYTATLLGWSGEGAEYGKLAFDIIYPFLSEVNNLVLLGYLDALLIGIITISGARSVSGALGGEGYLAGIQRLI